MDVEAYQGFVFSNTCQVYFPHDTLTLLMIVVVCAERFSHAMTRRHWSVPHAQKQPGTYNIENLFLPGQNILLV